MRIFLSCQQALRPHAVPAYGFWEYYFKNALSEDGHEVVQAPGVDWAEGLTRLSGEQRSGWMERTWTRTVEFLLAEHRRNPVGLFLSYLFPNQVEASAVRSIRSAGIPAVNFFCDNVRELVRVPESFASFDLHWVPEADAKPLYAAAGLPFIYAPMPMWVQPRYREAPAAETGGPVFVGSHDELREDLLGEAVGLGLPVEVFGAGWLGSPQALDAPARSLLRTLANQVDFVGREGLRGLAMRATYQLRKRRDRGWIERVCRPPLTSEGFFEATRGAAVSLGINRCPSFRHTFSSPLRYSRLRDIEAPMLGACYLTEAAPGVGDLYDIGTEIETYQGAGELVEKTKLLMGDPARRQQLRRRGQRRALSEHTIRRSLERILGKLGTSA